MKRRRMSEAELAVSRQLAMGVMYECQRASFGKCPKPNSIWPAAASLASVGLVILITLAVVSSCAAKVTTQREEAPVYVDFLS